MLQKTKLGERIARIYWSLVAMLAAAMLAVRPVFAPAIALVVRMISRNQRAVDEATSWLKRIVITWLILSTLGFIIAYLQGFIQGCQHTA